MGKELIFEGYRPGAIAQVLTLHMNYYAREWGLGQKFETYCARGMAEFFTDFNPEQDFFLAAWNNEGAMQASIVIDGHDIEGEGAQLRWFIVEPKAYGAGLGRYMLDKAMIFCHEKEYDTVFLATFAGLDASRHLYERVGFRLAEERQNDPWSGEIGELIFRWKKDT